MRASTVGEVVVLGLGNILMQDEGAGVHLVRRLEERYKFEPEIEIVDGGTSGLDLLPFFGSDKCLLICDAVNFNKAPGSIGIIENEAILTQLNPKTSLHHLGLADVISVSTLLDKLPRKMVLLGIQPEVMDLDLEMSETVRARIPDMLEQIEMILGNWGVQISPK